MPPPPIVLASASPQRRAILTQLGLPSVVRPANLEERSEGDPADVALANARAKAQAIAAETSDGDGPVLGVDTLVALDGRIYGKPADAGQAAAMLGNLQGRTHEVWSGIHLTGA